MAQQTGPLPRRLPLDLRAIDRLPRPLGVAALLLELPLLALLGLGVYLAKRLGLLAPARRWNIA